MRPEALCVILKTSSTGCKENRFFNCGQLLVNSLVMTPKRNAYSRKHKILQFHFYLPPAVIDGWHKNDSLTRQFFCHKQRLFSPVHINFRWATYHILEKSSEGAVAGERQLRGHFRLAPPYGE